MIIIESKTYLLKKEGGRRTEFGSHYTWFYCLVHFWLFCLPFSVCERQRVGVYDQIRAGIQGKGYGFAARTFL